MIDSSSQLVPSKEAVLDLLRETGALREGHFEFPNGVHSREYFQMPLAMRYHGNARVLIVALSRLLRMEHEVLAALPDCAIVAPAAGGIPVAFGVREALNADQIFWAEKENVKYRLRQYLDARGLRCILVGANTRCLKPWGTTPLKAASKNTRASAPISWWAVKIAKSVYIFAVVAL